MSCRAFLLRNAFKKRLWAGILVILVIKEFSHFHLHRSAAPPEISSGKHSILKAIRQLKKWGRSKFKKDTELAKGLPPASAVLLSLVEGHNVDLPSGSSLCIHFPESGNKGPCINLEGTTWSLPPAPQVAQNGSAASGSNASVANTTQRKVEIDRQTTPSPGRRSAVLRENISKDEKPQKAHRGSSRYTSSGHMSAHKLAAGNSSVQHNSGLREDLEEDAMAEFRKIQWEYPKPLDRLTLHSFLPENVHLAGKKYTAWDRRRWYAKGGQLRTGMTKKVRTNPKDIKQIWIWGERNSCTTLVTNLLYKNFGEALNCSTQQNNKKQCVIGGLPWKHAFQREAELKHGNQTLHILVTRHPYEWIKSMYSHPFYAQLHDKLPLNQFLSLEWISFRDRPSENNMRLRMKAKMKGFRDPSGNINRTNVPDCSEGVNDKGQCTYEDEDYACSVAPAYEVLVGTDDHPIPGCLGGNMSRELCPTQTKEYLCRVDQPLFWFSNPEEFVRLVELKFHAMNTADKPPPSDPKPVNYKDKICAHIGEGFMAPTQHGRCQDIVGNFSVNHSGLYICTEVKDYKNAYGGELAPSANCLGAAKAWGVCQKGGFLCRVSEWNVWDYNLVGWSKIKAALKEVPKSLDILNKWKQSSTSNSKGARLGGERAPSELEGDRDPDNGRRFPTILAMREAKIRDFFYWTKDLDFSAHIACRDFMLDPVEIMTQLKFEYELTANHHDQLSLENCVHQEGSCKSSMGGWDDPLQRRTRENYLLGHYMGRFDNESLQIINSWVDPDLEAALGYRLFDTVKEAKGNYSKESRCDQYYPERAWEKPQNPDTPQVKSYYCPPRYYR